MVSILKGGQEMYNVFGVLSPNAYIELVQLLLKKSDSFLISLPNMGKSLVNERNVHLLNGYPLGYSVEEDQDLHLAYIKWTKQYLDLIRNDIIRSYTDTGYLDHTTNIAMDIFHVAISERTIDFFSQTDDFSRWMYPAFPENPCFLSNGKCIFQCIAHERLCILYIEDKEIKHFLRRNRIKYIKCPSQQILSLS
jgi:hypothetical protein